MDGRAVVLRAPGGESRPAAPTPKVWRYPPGPCAPEAGVAMSLPVGSSSSQVGKPKAVRSSLKSNRRKRVAVSVSRSATEASTRTWYAGSRAASAGDFPSSADKGNSVQRCRRISRSCSVTSAARRSCGVSSGKYHCRAKSASTAGISAATSSFCNSPDHSPANSLSAAFRNATSPPPSDRNSRRASRSVSLPNTSIAPSTSGTASHDKSTPDSGRGRSSK